MLRLLAFFLWSFSINRKERLYEKTQLKKLGPVYNFFFKLEQTNLMAIKISGWNAGIYMVRLLNRLLVVHLFLNGWSPSSSKKIQTRPLEALFMKKEKHVHIRYIKRWNIFAHVRKGYDSHCSGLTLTSRMYLKQLNRESFQSKYPVVNKIDRKLYGVYLSERLLRWVLPTAQ